MHSWKEDWGMQQLHAAAGVLYLLYVQPVQVLHHARCFM